MTVKRNNPAYPPDGTPCDVGHFCITNQDKKGNYLSDSDKKLRKKCVSVGEYLYDKCPDCSIHGWCNNKNQCSCKCGWKGDTCNIKDINQKCNQSISDESYDDQYLVYLIPLCCLVAGLICNVIIYYCCFRKRDQYTQATLTKTDIPANRVK